MPKPEYLIYANNAPTISKDNMKSWQHNLDKPQYYPYDLFKVLCDCPDYFVRGLTTVKQQLLDCLVDDFGAIDLDEKELQYLHDRIVSGKLVMPKDNAFYENLDYETFYEDPNEGKHHYANKNVPIGWTIASYYSALFGTTACEFGDLANMNWNGLTFNGVSVGGIYLFLYTEGYHWADNDTVMSEQGAGGHAYQWGPGLTDSVTPSLTQAGLTPVPTGSGQAIPFKTVCAQFLWLINKYVKKATDSGYPPGSMSQNEFDCLVRFGHSGSGYYQNVINYLKKGGKLSELYTDPNFHFLDKNPTYGGCTKKGFRNYYDQKMQEYWAYNQKNWSFSKYDKLAKGKCYSYACVATGRMPPAGYEIEHFAKVYLGLEQPNKTVQKVIETMKSLSGGGGS
ncbi:MAG: hypothetical protein J1F35_06155 [Erysipelotrichales bacterium]|nr:hypothetical protein [Erysipelotrichales bacterium]